MAVNDLRPSDQNAGRVTASSALGNSNSAATAGHSGSGNIQLNSQMVLSISAGKTSPAKLATQAGSQRRSAVATSVRKRGRTRAQSRSGAT
jgi:hypothetical protein